MARADISTQYAEAPPRGARNVAGIVFALVLVLALGWIVRDWVSGAIQLPPAQRTASRFMQGETAQYLASQLSRTPLPKAFADGERGASWLLAGNLGPRVRQGCPGWLFLVDEFVVHPYGEDNARARLQAVVRLREALQSQGIALIVLTVPDKSRTQAAALCQLYRPAHFADRLENWVDALRTRGVPVADATEVLARQAASSGQAFLRTDTHWTEAGAQAAAQLLADDVRESGVERSPVRHYKAHVGPEEDREGDLVRLAGIDWLPAGLKPPADRVHTTTWVQTPAESADAPGATPADEADAALALFGDADLPTLALIGTSYSNTSNFHGFLEDSLQAEVPNFARDGGDFWGAAQAYLSSATFRETPPRMVLWEIPERVLQQPISPDERHWLDDPLQAGGH